MAWFGLLGTLAWNYRNHRTGKSRTICTITRSTLPRPIMAALLTIGFGYLLGHLWRGYPRT